MLFSMLLLPPISSFMSSQLHLCSCIVTKNAKLNMQNHNEKMFDFWRSKSMDIINKTHLNHICLHFRNIPSYRLSRSKYPNPSVRNMQYYKMRNHSEKISDFCHSKSIDTVYKPHINHYDLPFSEIRLYKLPRQPYTSVSLDRTCKNIIFHNTSNNRPKLLLLVAIHYYLYRYIIIMPYHHIKSPQKWQQPPFFSSSVTSPLMLLL